MTQPKHAQLDLLLSISDGLSRGSDEMLRVSPTDAMHPPSCSLAIRDAVEELKWLRAEIERLRVKNERLRERLLQEQAALVLDEIGAALERERVMRSALTDMLSGWRYIRETYGDLAGVGWDRVEQKSSNALEGRP